MIRNTQRLGRELCRWSRVISGTHHIMSSSSLVGMHMSQQASSSSPNLNKCGWSSSRLTLPLLSPLFMSQATMAKPPSTTSTTYSSPFFCLLVYLFNFSFEWSPPHWHKRLAHQSQPNSELSIYLDCFRIRQQKLLHQPTNPKWLCFKVKEPELCPWCRGCSFGDTSCYRLSLAWRCLWSSLLLLPQTSTSAVVEVAACSHLLSLLLMS